MLRGASAKCCPSCHIYNGAARRKLSHTIRIEATLVAAILLTTAALTTVSVPDEANQTTDAINSMSQHSNLNRWDFS